ncbi:MAG: acyl--CoA ligase [Bacteroidetes bacterium]|nr:acyl--CoA ligase [Bacteroidota bacterium]
MRVPELLHQSALKFPDQIAIYDNIGTLTYKELSDAVKSTATMLKANGIPVSKGVGVMGGNSRYFIIMVFAVMESGAVVMPVSNQVIKSELDDIIKTAGLSVLIDDGTNDYPYKNTSIINCVGQQWRIYFNESVAASSTFASHVNDPALIRFTSGTTGTSKGVILSHQTIFERTESANKVLQLGSNDRIIWVLSMAYHFVVSIILYLRYGSSVIICNEFLADTIIDETNRFNGTFLYASPMHIRMLASDNSGRMMPTLQKVISTSTAIPKEHCIAFKNRFGIAVSQAYGIIEIGLPIINFEKSDQFPDAVGYALPDYTVEILDNNFNILSSDETGHLAIKGPGMLDGYLNPPATRDQILNNGWFMTGDLASKMDDGLIRIEGRMKSMINVSGNKVFPEEVETILNQHPLIAESKVSGYVHSLLGESVRAEIVLHPHSTKPDTESLRTFCRMYLSAYKTPQQFIYVESLPKTDSGKLKRVIEKGH